MTETILTARRDLLIAPLLAALSATLWSRRADAAGPDPTMTIVKLPQEIVWTRAEASPRTASSRRALGKASESRLYYGFVSWYPGYMSAPHWYETDRYCVVVSGVWWVTSGETFDPENTVPSRPAVSFDGSRVRRIMTGSKATAWSRR